MKSKKETSTEKTVEIFIEEESEIFTEKEIKILEDNLKTNKNYQDKKKYPQKIQEADEETTKYLNNKLSPKEKPFSPISESKNKEESIFEFLEKNSIKNIDNKYNDNDESLFKQIPKEAKEEITDYLNNKLSKNERHPLSIRKNNEGSESENKISESEEDARLLPRRPFALLNTSDNSNEFDDSDNVLFDWLVKKGNLIDEENTKNNKQEKDIEDESHQNRYIKFYLDDYYPEIKDAKNLFAKYKEENSELTKKEKKDYQRAYTALNDIIEILSENSDIDENGYKIKGNNPYFHHESDNRRLIKILRKNCSIHNKVRILEFFRTEVPSDGYGHEKFEERYRKILDLPFDICEKINYDGDEIRAQLDKTHFGMDEIKNELSAYFESLKYRKENGTSRAKVLCLVGSPGTGKTTIARSLAEAIGVDTYKIGLANITSGQVLSGLNEAYRNAKEGEIAKILLKSKYSNPMVILDEIDKASNVNMEGGNVMYTLVSLLDPDNNDDFFDEYLGISLDISKILFICTANDESNIPSVLKDRLEIVRIPDYSKQDKIDIARKYMIPHIKETYKNNLENIEIPDSTLEKIIVEMTSQTQNRGINAILERAFERAVCIAKDSPEKFVITSDHIKEWFNKKEEDYTSLDDTDFNKPGVVNGMAVQNGLGCTTKIESSFCKGNGKVVSTGSIKEIMQESIQVAIGMLKTNYSKFNIIENFFSKNDILINYADTATPKDGPSAGVATTLAILSAIKNVVISNDIYITGEITLSGFVGPVGGVIEKAIGAYKNHAKYVFVPKCNHKDAETVREYLNKESQNIKIIEINDFFELVDNLCEIDERYKRLKN